MKSPAPRLHICGMQESAAKQDSILGPGSVKFRDPNAPVSDSADVEMETVSDSAVVEMETVSDSADVEMKKFKTEDQNVNDTTQKASTTQHADDGTGQRVNDSIQDSKGQNADDGTGQNAGDGTGRNAGDGTEDQVSEAKGQEAYGSMRDEMMGEIRLLQEVMSHAVGCSQGLSMVLIQL